MLPSLPALLVGCQNLVLSDIRHRRQNIPGTLKCEQCGKEIEVPCPSLAKDRKYCSTTCFGMARKGSGNPSWKGGPVTRICQNCGKEYTSKRSHDRRYCSQKCTAAVNLTTPEKHPRWRGGGVERICEWCGKEFKVHRCFVEKGNALYCSKACFGKAFSANHREAFTCETCDKEVELTASMAKKRRYCSRECFQKACKVKAGS